ncbi:hypothetical protein [Paenibacillus soyae]|uniref:Uncharacterized protein n=1 Tax=Paenibacillus soyae TaxID=2969249 RepID=A0A9X2S7P9_9BACL|nr:hypothetical protein [Paenibacillus soyae]MCR2803345.1 hypothetical protein [Paenibacillus soyae]
MNRAGAPMAAFIGTTPNIGTTSAAFAAAFRLAELSGLSVGYLCLNLKSAKLHRFLGIEEPELTLDKLQPELRSASLTPERLRRAAYAVPVMRNLSILFGNLDREGAEFIGAEEIDHLLDTAEMAFDFAVLDVGAYWDNAATVCCMRRALSRIVVTTPALSHFQEDGGKWIGGVSARFGIRPDQYDCIVVQPSWAKGGYGMKVICKELGCSPLGEFPLTEALLGGFDRGEFGAWLWEDPAGRTAMKKIAAVLMERHGLRAVFPSMMRQPWYRKLRLYRNGVSSS